MQRINQNMTGYRMPSYVEEILTENYCKNFVRMSIVKESGNYSFSYKPAGLSRLDPSAMSLYDKMLLIRNLISLNENTSDHLIEGESYLLEPELETLTKEMEEYKEKDEDVLTYALFAQVAIDYFKRRAARKNKVDPDLLNNENKAYPA